MNYISTFGNAVDNKNQVSTDKAAAIQKARAEEARQAGYPESSRQVSVDAYGVPIPRC